MNYQQAIEWLDTTVPKAIRFVYPGQKGVDRTRALLVKLGNPHDKIPVIHIAGTSGKGSTATILAAALQSQGFKVGLSLSPYILDVRERYQIDRQLLHERSVADVISEVRLALEDMADVPTYFEIVTATMYFLFTQEQCDYAIIETGLGGTFDATNVVNNPTKIAVITRIGFDHMRVLGDTLPQIAAQKAGIISRDNLTIALRQDPRVNDMISKRCREQVAELVVCNPADALQSSKVNLTGTIFLYSHLHLRGDQAIHLGGVQPIKLGLIGRHQVENATLALTALEKIADRDRWLVDWTKLTRSLAQLSMTARFDVHKLGEQTLVLDGAHNPQKMMALLETVKELFPGQPLTFLVGFKQGKPADEMMAMIEPLAADIILTGFQLKQDTPIHSINQAEVSALLKNYPKVKNVPNTQAALKFALQIKQPIIVTGSLYLCANVYSLIDQLRNEVRS